ncbi:MAG: elongation factor G [bacterium]
MKGYEAENIRNITIIGHGSAGKTSLAESIMFDAGVTNRMGTIGDGNTVMDFLPEEVSRQISTSSATASFEWMENQINIVDTPGYQDFVADALYALRVCEGALLVVGAVSGVRAQTERLFKFARENNAGMIAFVNKMDRERADFDKAIGEMGSVLGANPIPLQLPIGKEASFEGVVDLLTMKACIYSKDGSGNFEEKDIPDQLQGQADEYREKLVEAAAESEDELVEKYLEEGDLTDDEILRGLRTGVIEGDILPVLCGSATQNIGVRKLLDGILNTMPSPSDRGLVTGVDAKGNETERKVSADEPFSAFVYKTLTDPFAGKLTLFKIISGSLKADTGFLNSTRDSKERFGNIFTLNGKKQESVPVVSAGQLAAVAKLKETKTGDTLSVDSAPFVLPNIELPEPALSYAIIPKSKGDEEKVSTALTRLMEEDPSMKASREEETRESIISGMGQLHLEVTVERLKEKFGVEVDMKVPKVPYKETIKGSTKLQSRYKKQSGGRGQYGDVWLQIESLPRGSDFEFVNKIVGGVVPRQYIPAVEKGVREAMEEGVLAGYPVTDLRVTLYDGSYHAVDSSEMAFKIAASMGFKKGFIDARPVLLEPIVNLDVTVPDDFMGAVIGDLNSRRGKVVGMDPGSGEQVVQTQVPMSEVLTYAPDLRSMTEGRGSFSLAFSHYEEVPGHLAEKIIEVAKGDN